MHGAESLTHLQLLPQVALLLFKDLLACSVCSQQGCKQSNVRQRVLASCR